MALNPLNDLFQPQPQRQPQGGQNPLKMLQEFREFASGMTPEKARPASMMDAWEAEHKAYVEKAAWIKQMLSM